MEATTPILGRVLTAGVLLKYFQFIFGNCDLKSEIHNFESIDQNVDNMPQYRTLYISILLILRHQVSVNSQQLCIILEREGILQILYSLLLTQN